MKKYKIGYTTGVFDMFHVGHLNILSKSKELCDKLIVGVTTDELAKYKNITPIINFDNRKRIISAIKYVDEVVPQLTMNKLEAQSKYKFDVIFVGSDWKGTEKWNKIEGDFKKINVDVVYFDYTIEVSSTSLRNHISKLDN